eukprot:scaffold462_cov195-Pinguiococcus_pyrenoidosus.AAC.96
MAPSIRFRHATAENGGLCDKDTSFTFFPPFGGPSPATVSSKASTLCRSLSRMHPGGAKRMR